MRQRDPLPDHPANPCREWRGPRSPKGYGRSKGRDVHRLVVELAEGRPLAPGEVVMHRCDNPPCFLYEHLRRATQADNMRDAMAKGRHRFVAHRGEANGSSRLSAAQASEIRDRWRPGARYPAEGSTRQLAEEFGIGRTQVVNIGRGHKWAS